MGCAQRFIMNRFKLNKIKYEQENGDGSNNGGAPAAPSGDAPVVEDVEGETPPVGQEGVPPVPPKPDGNADLAEVKKLLDNAYKERDAAKAAVKASEKKQRDAELARLKEEGKDLDAANHEIADLTAERDTLREENIKLTRDASVRDAFSGLSTEFYSNRSQKLAQDMITESLIKDENGIWKAKNGNSLEDFVKSFSEDEDNKFLFKPKANSGAKPTTTAKPPGTAKKESVFDLSQEEALALARKGQLRL